MRRKPFLVRLTDECGSCLAAAAPVLIAADQRGKGLGRVLMGHVEDFVREYDARCSGPILGFIPDLNHVVARMRSIHQARLQYDLLVHNGPASLLQTTGL